MKQPTLTRRRLLQHLLATGAITAGGLAGLVRQALAMGNLPIAHGLHSLRGSVTINGKPASAGDLVQKGDAVATGPGGQAIVVIERDAFLLRENSQAVFGADALKQALRLVSGKVLAVFAQGEHRILTTAATIGIRGTAAYVEDVEPERMYFCLCYGESEVQTAGGQRASYATTHHESPRYIYRDAGAAKALVEAPMINHTDAELIMLEGLVGRYPPFYGKEKSGAY